MGRALYTIGLPPAAPLNRAARGSPQLGWQRESSPPLSCWFIWLGALSAVYSEEQKAGVNHPDIKHLVGFVTGLSYFPCCSSEKENQEPSWSSSVAENSLPEIEVAEVACAADEEM